MRPSVPRDIALNKARRKGKENLSLISHDSALHRSSAHHKPTAADRPSVAGPEVWVDSGRVFTREDGARLRPQWISTRFEELIRKYWLVRHRHSVEGWSVDRIARRHRISVRAVQIAIGGEPLPPIRFHDLRHGAATLALLGNVNMKVISETLGHARHSFTADTYTSVLPEVSRAAAEAVAAVVPLDGLP